MLRDEQDDLDPVIACCGCGSVLPLDVPPFATAPDNYLCFRCAERRGGVFDDDEDRWTIPPDLSFLRPNGRVPA